METFQKIKEHYRLNTKDEERLREIYPLVEPGIDRIIESLEKRIKEIVDPVTKEKILHYPDLPKKHKKWLQMLLRGPYDINFYKELVYIGKRHASLDINPHYVNVAMNTLRVLLIDILTDEIEDRRDRTLKKASLNKMLDLCLDVITSAYVEEELYRFSVIYRVRGKILQFAENFSGVMNLLLVVALIALSIGVVGLFVYDIFQFFHQGLNHGIISALGSLLIFWVLIELVNTEIEHMKGGKFNISVFIGVAIVALIRDILVFTLKQEKLTKVGYFLAGTVLILGIVYYLVTKAETKKEERR